MRVIITIVLFLFTVSCGESYRDNQVAFDGVKFVSNLKKDPNDSLAFSVTIKNASQSFEGAREAGRYESRKYCIEKISSSNIDWTIDPDSDDLTLQDGNLILSGRCLA